MTPLQYNIYQVLSGNPTPLMTAADIASKLNALGRCMPNKATSVGSAAFAMFRKGMFGRKVIRCGRSWTQINHNWKHGVQRFGYGPTKKAYSYLRSRTDEAHLGFKQGHQRYLGCPVKYVWPLTPVTKAQFEKEYPTDG